MCQEHFYSSITKAEKRNVLMFTNVIMTFIKMHLDFNIIIIINCSCLQLHMHICPKPSPFALSHGVQRRPHTYQKIYRLLFQNQILLLTLTIPCSSFYQTLSSNSFLLKTIHLYLSPTISYHYPDKRVFFRWYCFLFFLNF